MKQQKMATRLVFVLAFIAITIAFSAFRQKSNFRQNNIGNQYTKYDEDTTTRGKRIKSENEYNLAELSRAIGRIDMQMIALEKHLKSFDFSKVHAQIEKELANIDIDKIEQDVNKSLNNIDWDQVEMDFKDVKADLKKAEFSKKQMDELKHEIEKEKVNWQKEGKKIKVELESKLNKATQQMADHKRDLQQVQLFTDELDRDNLINKNKSFKVEVKNGDFYLDDKKQPQHISDKYRKYYKNDDFTIVNTEVKAAKI